jgi:hypothetical protein
MNAEGGGAASSASAASSSAAAAAAAATATATAQRPLQQQQQQQVTVNDRPSQPALHLTSDEVNYLIFRFVIFRIECKVQYCCFGSAFLFSNHLSLFGT